MSFDQSTITDVTIAKDGASLLIRWTSSAPSGTTYHVYLDGVRIYRGKGTQCRYPYPTGPVKIDVGTVGLGEEGTDFSSSLTSLPGGGDRAKLTWTGGTTLSPIIAGYRVYGESTPSGGISYTTPIATIPATTAGMTAGGYGIGGYGKGGYGRSQQTYSWTSDRLSGGTWHWGVKPFDTAGNEGTAVTVAVTIAAPPNPPAANASGVRLTYTYASATRIATLNWLASP